MEQFFNSILALLPAGWMRLAAWFCIVLIATIAASRLATSGLRRSLNSDINPLPYTSIIVNIVRATVWIIGGSIILDSCFGVDTSSLIAALGVGGIAVSLGFQDTLANLIGGLQVTFMGIVKPGDNIEVGDERGVVQDVTWRHTTIRDNLGQTVIIPNSIISTTALVHLLPAHRVIVPFAIPREGVAGREAPPEDVDELSRAIEDCAREAAAEVSPVIDGPRVYFAEIAELGIRGKVLLQIEDASQVAVAADAVVRALASTVG